MDRLLQPLVPSDHFINIEFPLTYCVSQNDSELIYNKLKIETCTFTAIS